MKLPTKRELEKKNAQITKLINQPMTEVRAASSFDLSSCLAMDSRVILLPCSGGRAIYKVTPSSRKPIGFHWREQG